MTRALLIDPFTKSITVEDVEGEEEIKELIGCVHLRRWDDPNLEIYCDMEGLLREPQAFWCVEGSLPIAGKSVALTEASAPDIERLIRWLNIKFTGIEQHSLGWGETPWGKAQLVAIIPQFVDLDEAKPALERILPKMRFWTVVQDVEGGCFRAELMESGGAGIKQIMELDHPTLEGLHELLPPGLIRIPRADTDSPAIVETWLEKEDG